MGNETINQIEENTKLIEECNDTLDLVSRTIELMDKMVGEE